MKFKTITEPGELDSLCRQLTEQPRVAFDTEFVAEDRYWPHLCLVQVAFGESLFLIDPLNGLDVTPFWKALAEGEQETIVHAGREELRFCLAAAGKRPARLFDVQIAAGLVGHEYPISYGKLVAKLLGVSPPKGETRTDWRKRPLSHRQLEYAASDVEHLLAVHEKLRAELTELDRESWLAAEMEAWQADVEAHADRPRWRRVSGAAGLSGKQLGVVRELWQWREVEAQRRDRPAKRVLRDDLIVEMARRQTSDPKQVGAIRGMERYRRDHAAFAECVRRGMESPERLPPRRSAELPDQLNLLAQFLGAALTSICRRGQVAPSLVGTASDVRELIAHELGYGNNAGAEIPQLAEGWRAEVVGNLLEDLLAGRRSIRIEDPHAEFPLTFDPGEES